MKKYFVDIRNIECPGSPPFFEAVTETPADVKLAEMITVWSAEADPAVSSPLLMETALKLSDHAAPVVTSWVVLSLYAAVQAYWALVVSSTLAGPVMVRPERVGAGG
jgi:hypothetical protein